jgi:hypothetical protein
LIDCVQEFAESLKGKCCPANWTTVKSSACPCEGQKELKDFFFFFSENFPSFIGA